MDKAMDRQAFLERLVRGSTLLGLGGIALAATHGSKTPEECFETTTHCKECWTNASCNLPEKGLEPDERAKKTRPA
jgi:hypothetical protein